MQIWQKFQNFVRFQMPLSPANQDCVNNMQKVRDNIRTELNYRDFEHVPPELSFKQYREAIKQRADQAKNQHYDRNPMSGGVPQPHPGPGNAEGNGGQPGGGGGCGRADCYMGPGWW